MKALIVGASGGLGAALIAQLADDSRFANINAWSRSEIPPSHTKVRTTTVDLCDESTIEAAAQSLGEVDLVIVATGLLHDDDLKPEKSWRSLDPNVMKRIFEINTIGPALVAKHVLPCLPRDRRAVFAALSARVGSISDNRLGGWHSYRASKSALNQLIKCFSIELAIKRPQAICVGLHPGTVDTALSKPYQAAVADARLFKTPIAARHLLGVLDRLTPVQSGGVFDWAGIKIPA